MGRSLSAAGHAQRSTAGWKIPRQCGVPSCPKQGQLRLGAHPPPPARLPRDGPRLPLDGLGACIPGGCVLPSQMRTLEPSDPVEVQKEG